MDMTDVFTYFERLGTEAGARVHISDRDPETGRRGFGIGMHEVQKRFLREPGPALVLGIESRQTLVERGFGQFLDLPCVRYLELPFTREEFRQAAASLSSVPVDAARLEDMRRSITLRGLDNISRNVTHRLNGVVLVALNQAVAASRRLAKSKDPSTGGTVLAASILSLTSSDGKVRESLAVLDREIGALEGVYTPQISEVLRDQRTRLGGAADELARFVAGITTWERGEESPESLGQLAEIGASVSQTFKEASAAFARFTNELRFP